MEEQVVAASQLLHFKVMIVSCIPPHFTLLRRLSSSSHTLQPHVPNLISEPSRPLQFSIVLKKILLGKGRPGDEATPLQNAVLAV